MITLNQICANCKHEMQFIADKNYYVCTNCGEVIFIFEKMNLTT